jgi:hypothetical protein
MPSEFKAEILESEIVIAHARDGHIYHFPILSNGTISLHGVRIEQNPSSGNKGAARRFLLDAHNAARAALTQSRA